MLFRSAGSVIPALYVSGIAHAPRGAWPLGFGDAYAADDAWFTRYVREARSVEGFDAMLAEANGSTLAMA